MVGCLQKDTLPVCWDHGGRRDAPTAPRQPDLTLLSTLDQVRESHPIMMQPRKAPPAF